MLIQRLIRVKSKPEKWFEIMIDVATIIRPIDASSYCVLLHIIGSSTKVMHKHFLQ